MDVQQIFHPLFKLPSQWVSNSVLLSLVYHGQAQVEVTAAEPVFSSHMKEGMHLVEKEGKRPGHRRQQHHADADDPHCLCPKPVHVTSRLQLPLVSSPFLPRVSCSTYTATSMLFMMLLRHHSQGSSPQAISTAECLWYNFCKDDNEHCKTDPSSASTLLICSPLLQGCSGSLPSIQVLL